MLQDEDDIKEQADVAQPKLGRIANNSRPVTLKARIDQQLTQRQYAACEVAQYLIYRPSFCAFALVVEPGLWHVFTECHDELDVSKNINLPQNQLRACVSAQDAHHIYPSPCFCVGVIVRIIYRSPGGRQQDSKGASENNRPYHRTSPLVFRHIKFPDQGVELGVGQDNHYHSMCCESEIIESDRGFWCMWVSKRILFIDLWRVQKTCCRNGVADEADNVEGRIVDRQTGC